MELNVLNNTSVYFCNYLNVRAFAKSCNLY